MILAGGLLVSALLLAAAGPSTLLLREQAWTAPGAERAYAMTHAQGECLAAPTPESEIGRALFRSPALLGGQASRAGLSCNSCHGNGGVNTHFLLPELTDRAGHSDVTAEWASATRGDGIANPIPIPDLAGASGKPSFGQGQEPSLEVFVRGVIEDEFGGERPPAQAFDGVIAYLRALRLSACPQSDAAITLASAGDDVRRALAASAEADRETASLLVLAAQDAIGRIVERLPTSRFARDRRRLEALARELGAARAAPDIASALAETAWRTRFDAAIARIAPRERRTYFNQATLATALEH